MLKYPFITLTHKSLYRYKDIQQGDLNMIELNAITTLCLACILYLLGKAIVNHVNFLKRICIPAPVIGGLIFAI